MQAIIPYINFNGNGAEALAFYATALNGKTVHSQTFGESGMPIAEDAKDRIMHALFEADKLQFMISDCQPGKEVSSGTQVHLSLNFDNLELINTTFTNLADGGKVTMELQDTFWGARFGMLEDKFGVNWMFNFDYPKENN
ncbi:MAG: VOC family protein [Ferruginibacter sp.]|nr:VOC family protein [Ferruginibacter sp.]